MAKFWLAIEIITICSGCFGSHTPEETYTSQYKMTAHKLADAMTRHTHGGLPQLRRRMWQLRQPQQ